MKKNGILNIIIISSFLIVALFFIVNDAGAETNCYSLYGIWSTYDYLTGGCKCMSGYAFGKDILGNVGCISASQLCKDEYGYNATNIPFTNNCECLSGYVFGKDIFGNTSCVSADQLCKDQYGIMARHNTLFDKCECMIGYVFGEDYLGKTACVSEDQWCQDKYGFNSKYNILSDKCECKSGYEFTLKSSGGLECVSCFSKYGLHSSYNYLSGKCECDDGYTLDSNNRCVEKQNNVYFLLKELNTDDNEAVIQSEYDSQKYLITYGYGCYDFSIKRYLNNRIVINLGTDFNVSIWDKIVLYDDNEVCDILSVKKVNYSYSFPTLTPTPKPNTATPVPTPKCPANSYLGIDNKCYCNSGYESDSSQTICAKSIICQLNSSKINNVCVCNSGYVMRDNKCLTNTEDCVQEYGQHTYGTAANNGASNCYCVDGYEWNSSRTACVKIEEEKVPQLGEGKESQSQNSIILNSDGNNSAIDILNQSDEPEKKQGKSISKFLASIANVFKNFFGKIF